jgi:hypothetical protein
MDATHHMSVAQTPERCAPQKKTPLTSGTLFIHLYTQKDGHTIHYRSSPI